MVWEYDQLLAKKPNRSDAVFPAHQDSGYWYTPTGLPTATATCSLAINDADQAFMNIYHLDHHNHHLDHQHHHHHNPHQQFSLFSDNDFV